jgi:hypothetical protein
VARGGLKLAKHNGTWKYHVAMTGSRSPGRPATEHSLPILNPESLLLLSIRSTVISDSFLVRFPSNSFIVLGTVRAWL